MKTIFWTICSCSLKGKKKKTLKFERNEFLRWQQLKLHEPAFWTDACSKTKKKKNRKQNWVIAAVNRKQTILSDISWKTNHSLACRNDLAAQRVQCGLTVQSTRSHMHKVSPSSGFFSFAELWFAKVKGGKPTIAVPPTFPGSDGRSDARPPRSLQDREVEDGRND